MHHNADVAMAVAIDGGALTLDVPLTTALEAKLAPATVTPFVQERVPVLLDPVPGRPRVVLVVDDLRQRGRQHPR